ncbi:integrase, catalytic region, zinc finger, CCHC-type containing protein [Tanacetum coccineum]
MCKQEEHEIQLSVEQADWRDDADDELEDQELEAHYMYISNIQEVIPDVADNSGPIFDTEPLEKVLTIDDNYNVFANERQHPEQPESVNDIYLVEQGDSSNTSNNGGKADPDDQMLQKERQLLNESFQNDRPCKNEDAPEFLEVFEIKKFKAQLQDKNIAISELKKLIAKLKGKFMDTKFVKPSVTRQSNSFKFQKPSILVPISSREPMRTVYQSVATPHRRIVVLKSIIQKPRSTFKRLVEIILLIVDSGCSKHMTGNLKLLINFVEKFMDTMRTSPNPICLMAKASLSQAWLRHRRLSHLNFDTINLLSKNDIVNGLLKLKFLKTIYVLLWELTEANGNINQAVNAQFGKDEFIYPFGTPVHEVGELSSYHFDQSNMHTVYQRHPFEYHWTREHPLEQVLGYPSRLVRTRRQLGTNGEMCMFAHTVSREEPKNIKEAMDDHAWIEVMQEELHHLND